MNALEVASTMLSHRSGGLATVQVFSDGVTVWGASWCAVTPSLSRG